MVKFAHISNYSNLMRFTIFKCGSGYYSKKPQMTYKQSFEVFILADMSAFCPHFFVKLKIFVY